MSDKEHMNRLEPSHTGHNFALLQLACSAPNPGYKEVLVYVAVKGGRLLGK